MRGLSKAATSFGVKQCERLGFVSVGTGVRGTNLLWLSDGWRTIDAVEAARRVQLAKPAEAARAAVPKPPKPVKQPKPVKVARPRTMQRRVPSVPRLSWQDDGR